MITAKEFPGKTFESKKDLFEALIKNKSDLIASKKMQTKEADSVICIVSTTGKGEGVKKSDAVDVSGVNELKATLVINSTNIMDSHSDVHIKGLWKKSVKEQKNLYLLQEHKMTFDHVISNDVTASTKEMDWKELGQNFIGTTEALIFDTVISKDRNEYMFNQYANGFVKEHSVGMRYVSLELAINSDSRYDENEKEVWDKYIDQVANREDAENQGYFWVVTEAKIIEGSAVVKGSNSATPTITVEAVTDTSAKAEPPSGTQTIKTVKGKVPNNQMYNFFKNL